MVTAEWRVSVMTTTSKLSCCISMHTYASLYRSRPFMFHVATEKVASELAVGVVSHPITSYDPFGTCSVMSAHAADMSALSWCCASMGSMSVGRSCSGIGFRGRPTAATSSTGVGFAMKSVHDFICGLGSPSARIANRLYTGSGGACIETNTCRGSLARLSLVRAFSFLRSLWRRVVCSLSSFRVL